MAFEVVFCDEKSYWTQHHGAPHRKNPEVQIDARRIRRDLRGSVRVQAQPALRFSACMIGHHSLNAMTTGTPRPMIDRHRQLMNSLRAFLYASVIMSHPFLIFPIALNYTLCRR